jgi:hypothetical protein
LPPPKRAQCSRAEWGKHPIVDADALNHTSGHNARVLCVEPSENHGLALNLPSIKTNAVTLKNQRILYALAAVGVIGFLVISAQVSPGRATGSDGEDEQSGGDNSRVKRGLALAPVPLNLKGKNRDLVGLGSYIVNAQGGCNDCHTQPSYAPGHDPFQGQPGQVNADTYLGGGRAFGPLLVSRNITPDEHGLPAGLTRDQFITALRTGIDTDGEILQVMPWPVYGDMTDRDLKAIYEYLRSIPSLTGPGPRNP